MWQRSDDWVGTEVEDSFVMIHLETGTYLTLNRTASAVWDALATPQSQSAVEARLVERFDVAPETCSEAVTRLLDRMRELRIATPV